jgi:hypothetical protein
MAENGTVAYVTQLPECDICKYVGTQSEKDSPARALYDFRTKDGRWAMGCAPHWESHRMHEGLGIGKGQMLVVKAA